MREYKLVWDEKASEDIEDIWDYIAWDSKAAAQNVVNNIRACAKSLKLNPYLGQEEELFKKYKLGHRYLVYSHYKIIYKVYEDKIFIVIVFDTRRKPSKIRKIVKKRLL